MLKKQQKVYWCIVDNSDVYFPDNALPYASAESLELPDDKAVYIGQLEGKPCYWLSESEIEQTLDMVSLRSLLEQPQELFLMVSRAIQYGHMYQSQRFCSHCGGRTRLNHRDMAMQCSDCRTLHYPRIFPCIIVAVQKNKQILLAQHARHTSGMHTVIAGFVEAGETLEQCVAREVKEETGIDVTNIRYYGSQPWAFPSSMMVAFTADYLSGEIKVDPNELSSADWFDVNQLPSIAPKGTIARELIDHTLDV